MSTRHSEWSQKLGLMCSDHSSSTHVSCLVDTTTTPYQAPPAPRTREIPTVSRKSQWVHVDRTHGYLHVFLSVNISVDNCSFAKFNSIFSIYLGRRKMLKNGLNKAATYCVLNIKIHSKIGRKLQKHFSVSTMHKDLHHWNHLTKCLPIRV